MSSYTLHQQILRTVCIFQGLIAAPVMCATGAIGFSVLFDPRGRIYDLVTFIFTGLMAATIIIIAIIQRSVILNKTNALWFEIAKSGLATGLWLWLILDSIFDTYYWPTPNERHRRTARSAVSVLLLLLAFFPTLVFAIFEKRWEKKAEEAREGARIERGIEGGEEEAPLLGGHD